MYQGPGDTAINGTHSLKHSKNAKINTFQKLFGMRTVPWSLMSCKYQVSYSP